MPEVKQEDIIAVLKQCYDPEIPVDLWNLGLIYDIHLEHKDTGSEVTITMTLTTPGCGLANYIAQEVKTKLEGLADINEARVKLTFDPRWNPEMMSAEARQKLGLSTPR